MICDRSTASCPEILDGLRTDAPINACCLAHLLEMLTDLTNLFNEIGLHYWLDYGSLLGMVRGGGLIPWDKDIDFGIRVEDLDKLLGISSCLEGMGYYFVYPLSEHSLHPRVHYSRSNLIFCDIYLWEKRSIGTYHMVCHPGSYGSVVKPLGFPLYFHECASYFYDNLDKIGSISIPSRVEEYLELRYGVNWRIPDGYFYDKYPGGVGVA